MSKPYFDKKKYQREYYRTYRQNQKADAQTVVISQERCDACTCCIGPDFIHSSLIPYREHNLCSHCVVAWKGREKREGKEISWEELTEK